MIKRTQPRQRIISAGEPPKSPYTREYVHQCITDNQYSRGLFVEQFEDEFKRHTGAKFALAVSSGTAALHLILAGLPLGAGDEIIVPSLTYIATANVVRYIGAVPVFVDSDIDTWNIDPAAVRAAITEKTRAIIAVHLYGNPAAMNELQAIATEHDLYLIEDAAQALNATYDGQHAGTLSEAGSFSFYGNKTITTGEGGMIITDNPRLYRRMKLLHGQAQTTRRYLHNAVGFNYRMPNLAGALGLAQMRIIDDIAKRRAEIMEQYRERLRSAVSVQCIQSGTSGNWAFGISLPAEIAKVDIVPALLVRGIDTRPFFYPIQTMQPYRQFDRHDTPVAVELSKRGIVLPTHTGLSSDDIDYVCDILIELLES